MRSRTETRSGVPGAQGGQSSGQIRRRGRYGAGIIVYGTLPIAANTVPIMVAIWHGGINAAYMCPSCKAGMRCRLTIGITYIEVPNDYHGTAAVVR